MKLTLAALLMVFSLGHQLSGLLERAGQYAPKKREALR
jgi:hypothetical protein